MPGADKLLFLCLFSCLFFFCCCFFKQRKRTQLMSVFDSVQLHSRSRLCSRERLHAVHPISRESFFSSFFLLRLKQFLWACLSRLFKEDCQPLLLLTPLSFSRQTVNHSLNWLLSPVPGRLSTIALAGSSLLFRADCRPLSLLAALSCPRQTVNHRLY